LLKIIHNLGGDKGPKLAEIEMPGRTTKALTHAWAKIKAEAAAAGTGGEGVAKPIPTPRKKKAAAAEGKLTLLQTSNLKPD
jgi:hypothetical protein